MTYYEYNDSHSLWYVVVVIIIIVVILIVAFAVHTNDSNPLFMSPSFNLGREQLTNIQKTLFPQALSKCPIVNNVSNRIPVFRSVQTAEQASKPVLFPADSFKGSVHLSGDQEVPPVKTKAKGKGYIIVDSEDESVCYDIHVKKLSSSAQTAAMYSGSRGETGMLVKDLTLNESKDGKYYQFKGEWKASDATQPLTQSDLDALLSGSVYISISTKKYPQGEIRGQSPF